MVKHRIAVLSDIHGNLTALKAVLEDAKAREVNDYWLLGDTYLSGPGTLEIAELLGSLPISASIRGNWEDMILNVIKGRKEMTDKPKDVYMDKLVDYFLLMSDEKLLKDMENLPAYQERQVEGLKFLISHNLPDKSAGDELRTASPQENYDRLFENFDADIALYGHVHHQMMRYSSKNQMIINPGSVGSPYFYHTSFEKDLRAQYAILEVDEYGLADINFRKVVYDKSKELDLAKAKELPFYEVFKAKLEIGKNLSSNADVLKEIIDKQY